MKKFTVNTKHGKFTGLTLSKSMYVFGGTLSVTLWDESTFKMRHSMTTKHTSTLTTVRGRLSLSKAINSVR